MPQSPYIVTPTSGQSSYVVKPDPAGAALNFPATPLSGFTETDPGGIKSATVQGGTVSFAPRLSYINATLINPGTVSNLPSNGLRWTRPSLDLTGAVRGSSTADAVQQAFGITSDSAPLSLDLILGWFLTNGTVGFGGGIQYAGGNWQAFVLAQVATVWTITAAAATNASCVGSRAMFSPNTAAAASRIGRCVALNSSGVGLATTTPGSTANQAAVTLADNLNTFGLYCGWATGVGGTSGTTVKIAGAELIADLSNFA